MILNQQCKLNFKTGLMDYGNCLKIIDDLIARTVENFWIECLFRQSNNEFIFRDLYLPIKHKIKIKIQHRQELKGSLKSFFKKF